MATTRDLIEVMRREIRDTDLQPARASELLAKLTALVGNVLSEVRDAEMDFNKVLMGCLDSEGSGVRARIKAQTSPEHSRYREAKDAYTVVVELIRSLRQVLRTATEEMKLTR